MRKKIIFVAQTLELGGAERVLVNIINNINYDKFDIELVVFDLQGGYYNNLKENKQVKIISYLNRYKNKKINFLYKLLKTIIYIRYSNSNYIFSQLLLGRLIIFFKFLFKDKKIIYRETNMPFKDIENESFIKKIILKIFYKFKIQNFDRIICQSLDMKEGLLKVNKNLEYKIVIINNPVDINFIRKNYNEECKELENITKILKLITIGRLTYQKGYDLLIDTLSKLEDINFILYIIGKGEEEQVLKKLVKEKKMEDKIFFLGVQKNPYKYLKNADFFISSSRFEGFPNVVLEAGVCGIPVIANNYLGGINEIIIPGINGEIIDITDEKALKKVFEKNYDKDKIIKNIEDRFSMRVILKEYEKIFL